MTGLAQHVLKFSLGALLLPALVSACGTSGASEPEPRSVPGGGTGVLSGSWELENLEQAADAEPAEGLVILFKVTDETSSISVFTNCNSRFGSYTLSPDGSASFSLPGATKKACDEEATRLEDLAVTLVEATVTWHHDGDELVFTTATPVAHLRFRPVG